LWIKNPLAILNEDVAGKLVASNKKIVVLVKISEVPPHGQIFNASQHWFYGGRIKRLSYGCCHLTGGGWPACGT
jgi:hypothetical protein